MFNPFAAFEQRFLSGFRQKGVQAFVQQTYNRGKAPLNNRPAFLLTHFSNLEWAREHYDVLQRDPNRKIYLVENAAHIDALSKALAGRDAFYYTILLVKGASTKAKKILEAQIREYIERHTAWRPVRDEEVELDLEVNFGDIYVKLSYGNNRVKDKLDNIDNPKHHVL